ncbi:MAG: T9SS type A sorting domain-containing protein [Chitinophagales bacterium]|nr:T9SS type A sorting domain-containing protein [Chitinophagaceae bacterium]MCB9065834.1 T9SS type A sorting domain-containing protein [Chitinophagales bacterium]
MYNSRLIFKLLAVIMLFAANTHAQTQVELHITHMLYGGDFAFNKAAKNDIGKDFNISRCEYYISKITIIHDGGTETDVPNHYILANGSQDVVSPLGTFSVTSIEGVKFYIGVDTPNNHSDPSKFPTTHPLYPQFPSMHWGWADGYRFVALEGMAGPSLDQKWELHGLGDQHYKSITVTVNGMSKGGKLIIPLYADYAGALKSIDLSKAPIAHGLNMDDATMLNNFNSDVFKPGNPVSVDNAAQSLPEVNIYPNPSNGLVNVQFAQGQEADIYVYDVQGRTIAQKHNNAGSNTATLNINTPGIYMLKVQSSEKVAVMHKLQIQ